MNAQVLYIHGGDSFGKYEDFLRDLQVRPARDPFGLEKKPLWVETLREELNEFGVLMPTMPNKQNAKYDEWRIWLERHFEFLHGEVILVGWSLGGMFLAKYLSEEVFPVKIKAIYLLAAPSGEFGKVQFDETGNDCGSFQFSMKKLANLSKQTEKINIWHSEDDFVVPYGEAVLYKEHLRDENLVSFSDKNHFLLSEFPELIKSIKGL